MCGICGFIIPHTLGKGEAIAVSLKRGVGALAHRGPDGHGTVTIETSLTGCEYSVGLGHTRLSVVDLSPSGSQPMWSDSAALAITFNGEIYNHRALRAALDAHRNTNWRGHSDTEVLIEAIEAFGALATLSKVNGMFAFAAFDRRTGRLTLARDRFGEKPLYYGFIGKCFVFASEVRAIRAMVDSLREEVGLREELRLDMQAISEYIRLGYIPAPRSVYARISKLEPGTYLNIGADELAAGNTPVIKYYDLEAEAAAAAERQFRGSAEDAELQLEALLMDAVALRMEADVPLGAFLSGGVDSSAIVAAMQAQSSRKVRTFTIGFEQPNLNEAKYAAAVAEHLGTDHTQLYFTSKEAIACASRLGEQLDEPFADSSFLATRMVAALTRSHVTVALSGDGGDELFGGYNRYVWAKRLIATRKILPSGVRFAAPSIVAEMHKGGIGNTLDKFGPVLSRYWSGSWRDRSEKVARILATNSEVELYSSLVSVWDSPSSICTAKCQQVTPFDPNLLLNGEFTERMMLWDTLLYLPNDILTKVDIATMSVALEARAPFLDHRLFEFAWRLPLRLKVNRGTGKSLLRKVLHKRVPAKLLDRPKAGFAVPIDEWLKGPLFEWASELLSRRSLEQHSLFNTTAVQEAFRQHLSGERRAQHQLWTVLMFQEWYQTNMRSVL